MQKMTTLCPPSPCFWLPWPVKSCKLAVLSMLAELQDIFCVMDPVRRYLCVRATCPPQRSWTSRAWGTVGLEKKDKGQKRQRNGAEMPGVARVGRRRFRLRKLEAGDSCCVTRCVTCCATCGFERICAGQEGHVCCCPAVSTATALAE